MSLNRDEGKNQTCKSCSCPGPKGKPCLYKSQVESRSTGDWRPWRELIKEEFEFELAIMAFL